MSIEKPLGPAIAATGLCVSEGQCVGCSTLDRKERYEDEDE